MVQIDKRFNINRYFQEYKPILRDVFLEYYGDEYAHIINNAFDNFSFIGYLTPTNISNLIFDLGNEISGKLEEAFLEETQLNNIPNIKANAFFYGFEKKEKCPLYEILERLDGHEQELRWLFGISSQDPNYQEKIQASYKTIDATREVFYKYQNMFDEQIRPYQEYFNYARTLEKLEGNSKPQYINYFIRKIFSSLTKRDKEFYLTNQDKFASQDTAAVYFRQMQCFRNYISQYSDDVSFRRDGLISYFSSKNEEKMSNPQESKYITKNRIAYFKNLGIDLGDNYEDYLNNSEVQKLWPSLKLITEINELKSEIYEQTIKDFFLTIPLYQENKSILENTGFTAKMEEPFFFSTYLKPSWNISTNYLMKATQDVHKPEDSFILHPIILFCSSTDNHDFDKNIIHELNHLIEERIKKVIKTIVGTTLNLGVITECGFNCKSEEEKIEKLNKNKYELFNETINDIIAEEITNILHSKGIFLFTDPNYTKKNESICIYTYSKPLADAFFNTFRKLIIYARLTGNREELYATIGQENFDVLNDLINDFYISFDIFTNNERLDQALEDIKNGNTSDDVILYQKFLDKSKSILENMQIHSTPNIKQRKLYF